ncbi:hypothetical protein FOZ62_032411 [Perkinsus olseni]|uniref:Uncharacterized protein n=1 Tax=Perkinsus olseni TaxID=32597 RepID=A0A7J6SG83_PEROL|nr:hypothetical protein FOZ62_032411 [Perkinsus olseni]
MNHKGDPSEHEGGDLGDEEALLRYANWWGTPPMAVSVSFGRRTLPKLLMVESGISGHVVGWTPSSASSIITRHHSTKPARAMEVDWSCLLRDLRETQIEYITVDEYRILVNLLGKDAIALPSPLVLIPVWGVQEEEEAKFTSPHAGEPQASSKGSFQGPAGPSCFCMIAIISLPPPSSQQQQQQALDLFSALNPRNSRRVSLVNVERLVDTLSNSQAELLRKSLTNIVDHVDVRGEIDRHTFVQAVEKSTARKHQALGREGNTGGRKCRPSLADVDASNPFHRSRADFADTGDVVVAVPSMAQPPPDLPTEKEEDAGATQITSPMVEQDYTKGQRTTQPSAELHTAPVNLRVMAEEAGQTAATGRPTAISNFHLRLEVQLQQREENRIKAVEKRQKEIEQIERRECTFKPKINRWKGLPPQPSNYRRGMRERGMEHGVRDGAHGNSCSAAPTEISPGAHPPLSPGHSKCILNTSFEERERNQEQSELEQECTFQPNLNKFLDRSKKVTPLRYSWEGTAEGPRYRERRQHRRFAPAPRSPTRSGKMTTAFWAEQLRFSPGESPVCTVPTSAQNFTEHPHYDPSSKCIHHIVNARELRFNQQDWGKYIRAERV